MWQRHCDMSVILISNNEYGSSVLQLSFISVVKIDRKWNSWTFNAPLFHTRSGVDENLNVFWLSFISVTASGLHLYAHERYLRSRHYVNITIVFTLFLDSWCFYWFNLSCWVFEFSSRLLLSQHLWSVTPGTVNYKQGS